LIHKSKCIHVYEGRGVIRPVAQRIHRVLNIFDHTTAQIAISVFFLNAAITLTASSGREVQIATIVTHINASGSHCAWAIQTALSTINFPHQTSQQSHKRTKRVAFILLISSIFSVSESFELFAIENV